MKIKSFRSNGSQFPDSGKKRQSRPSPQTITIPYNHASRWLLFFYRQLAYTSIWRGSKFVAYGGFCQLWRHIRMCLYLGQPYMWPMVYTCVALILYCIVLYWIYLTYHLDIYSEDFIIFDTNRVWIFEGVFVLIPCGPTWHAWTFIPR